MKITFPDKRVAEFEKGVSALDIANSISKTLAKKCVYAKVNDVDYDLNRPILEDSTLVLVTLDDEGINDFLNHSCSHLMASAIKRLYPKAMFGVGPAIEEGFYYDVNPGEGVKITEEDLEKIEKVMHEIANQEMTFERREVSKEEALEIFKKDKYKKEIINELEEGVTITLYKHDDFCDLCRGPHVRNTKFLKFFKLLNIRGA